MGNLGVIILSILVFQFGGVLGWSVLLVKQDEASPWRTQCHFVWLVEFCLTSNTNGSISSNKSVNSKLFRLTAYFKSIFGQKQLKNLKMAQEIQNMVIACIYYDEDVSYMQKIEFYHFRDILHFSPFVLQHQLRQVCMKSYWWYTMLFLLVFLFLFPNANTSF